MYQVAIYEHPSAHTKSCSGSKNAFERWSLRDTIAPNQSQVMIGSYLEKVSVPDFHFVWTWVATLYLMSQTIPPKWPDALVCGPYFTLPRGWWNFTVHLDSCIAFMLSYVGSRHPECHAWGAGGMNPSAGSWVLSTSPKEVDRSFCWLQPCDTQFQLMSFPLLRKAKWLPIWGSYIFSSCPLAELLHSRSCSNTQGHDSQKKCYHILIVRLKIWTGNCFLNSIAFKCFDSHSEGVYLMITWYFMLRVAVMVLLEHLNIQVLMGIVRNH